MKIEPKELKNQLIKDEVLNLFVEDIEYGLAMSSFENKDGGKFFEETVEEKAEYITKEILSQIEKVMKEKVKKILEEEE